MYKCKRASYQGGTSRPREHIASSLLTDNRQLFVKYLVRGESDRGFGLFSHGGVSALYTCRVMHDCGVGFAARIFDDLSNMFCCQLPKPILGILASGAHTSHRATKYLVSLQWCQIAALIRDIYVLVEM